MPGGRVTPDVGFPPHRCVCWKAFRARRDDLERCPEHGGACACDAFGQIEAVLLFETLFLVLVSIRSEFSGKRTSPSSPEHTKLPGCLWGVLRNTADLLWQKHVPRSRICCCSHATLTRLSPARLKRRLKVAPSVLVVSGPAGGESRCASPSYC